MVQARCNLDAILSGIHGLERMILQQLSSCSCGLQEFVMVLGYQRAQFKGGERRWQRCTIPMCSCSFCQGQLLNLTSGAEVWQLGTGKDRPIWTARMARSACWELTSVAARGLPGAELLGWIPLRLTSDLEQIQAESAVSPHGCLYLRRRDGGERGDLSRRRPERATHASGCFWLRALRGDAPVQDFATYLGVSKA